MADTEYRAPVLTGHVMVGMHLDSAPVGDLVGLPIPLAQVNEIVALEEAFPSVLHAPLHMGLVPGAPHPCRVAEMKPRCWEYSRKPRVSLGCSASAPATAAWKLSMTLAASVAGSGQVGPPGISGRMDPAYRGARRLIKALMSVPDQS